MKRVALALLLVACSVEPVASVSKPSVDIIMAPTTDASSGQKGESKSANKRSDITARDEQALPQYQPQHQPEPQQPQIAEDASDASDAGVTSDASDANDGADGGSDAVDATDGSNDAMDAGAIDSSANVPDAIVDSGVVAEAEAAPPGTPGQSCTGGGTRCNGYMHEQCNGTTWFHTYRQYCCTDSARFVPLNFWEVKDTKTGKIWYRSASTNGTTQVPLPGMRYPTTEELQELVITSYDITGLPSCGPAMDQAAFYSSGRYYNVIPADGKPFSFGLSRHGTSQVIIGTPHYMFVRD